MIFDVTLELLTKFKLNLNKHTRNCFSFKKNHFNILNLCFLLVDPVPISVEVPSDEIQSESGAVPVKSIPSRKHYIVATACQ
jgi:hypothetical protein